MTDILAPLLSLLGLYVFITSFFLAKRSLPHVATCNEAADLLQTTLNLTKDDYLDNIHINSILKNNERGGCWLDRKVDSMVMVVVDALRFDFALHHLPRSVGARIQQINGINASTSTSSRLLQFVADPPTVTMQRLKALTTGGLPTFADISGNMGGASVEEDTWISQLKSTPFASRRLPRPSKTAFVGDDTWVDLFPNQLDEAYPYPSFNTRDLETVDNGCLEHIPDLLDKLRTSNSNKNNNKNNKDEEVMIVHFLGVDHVGHTYGPHNQHMDTKLKQMDEALFELLVFMDRQQESCSVAFIFGDHGMTEDGNHGGGSDEEINAALFAHFSPACGNMTLFDDGSVAATTSDTAQTAFTSIHQIDLVPTLSLLLGLPIPYANLGSIVPALSLFSSPAQTATALALNAAQVWRYFTMYSTTANQLPGLDELEERLQSAVKAWKDSLASQSDSEVGGDSTMTLKACSLFKVFLLEALQLGQEVWTRFDIAGMTLGGVIFGIGILVWSLPFFLDTTSSLWSDGGVSSWRAPPPAKLWELLLTLFFAVFSCGVLTFGNSYILEEKHIYMHMIGVLSLVLVIRLASTAISQPLLRQYAPLIIPVASRMGELFVTGHGQDPSTRVHSAHHGAVFLSSIFLLIAGRYSMFKIQITSELWHMVVDCAAMLCLGQAWWEKRNPDPERHGFIAIRCSVVLILLSLPHGVYRTTQHRIQTTKERYSTTSGDALAIIIKLLILVMIVTGPSSATSVVFFAAQAACIAVISSISGPAEVPSAVMAALWRFIVRHIFFATNHGCTFSRLHLSAAFVATNDFNFVFAGSSLFINTFGWEIVGLSSAWWLAKGNARPNQNRSSLWRWYCLYQLIETLCSCVSVSVLRRHLMVWDIYAPHFLFVAIFMILFATFQLLAHYFNRNSV